MPKAYKKKDNKIFEHFNPFGLKQLIFEINKDDDIKDIINKIPNEIIIGRENIESKKLIDIFSEINKDEYEIKEIIFEFEKNNPSLLSSLKIKTEKLLPREEIAKFYKLNLEYGYMKGYTISKKEENEDNEENRDIYQYITFVPSL